MTVGRLNMDGAGWPRLGSTVTLAALVAAPRGSRISWAFRGRAEFPSRRLGSQGSLLDYPRLDGDAATCVRWCVAVVPGGRSE